MTELHILNQFKISLVSFLDELIEQFPLETDLVIFRIFIKDKVPIISIINYMIQKLLPLKDMITSRDEDFFLNHCSIFDSIQNKGSILHFKKLWRSPCLDSDDKILIWKWFDTFIIIAEKYQKIIIKNNQKSSPV